MKLMVKERSTGRILASGMENDDVILCEGNWYFAPDAVDMSHLKITERTYTCPYKGVCYWIDLESPNTQSLNVAWVYQNPKHGFEDIKGRIGFYFHDTSGTVSVEEAEPEALKAK
jgi:uncharacterized protein (DUF427 family)